MYVRMYVCRYENAIKLIDQLVNAYITIWKDVKVNKYWDVMWNTQNNICGASWYIHTYCTCSQ